MTITDIPFAERKGGTIIKLPGWSGFLFDIIPGCKIEELKELKMIEAEGGHINIIVAQDREGWRFGMVADDGSSSQIWRTAHNSGYQDPIFWNLRFETLQDLIDYIMIETL